mmetsp:Transcript_13877/g.40505  ORF Transcript_13877/g.40505 Transcript_13877/m.40505 type:complete len:123 (-) Transcript_13877:92-460(-)
MRMSFVGPAPPWRLVMLLAATSRHHHVELPLGLEEEEVMPPFAARFMRSPLLYQPASSARKRSQCYNEAAYQPGFANGSAIPDSLKNLDLAPFIAQKFAHWMCQRPPLNMTAAAPWSSGLCA